MINIETIKFIKLLDELAEMSSNGIESFEKANQDNHRDKIFYDEKSKDGKGGYRIVLDSFVRDDHHDIKSFYDSLSNEYDIKVIINEVGSPCVKIAFIKSEEEIVIENGVWYFVWFDKERNMITKEQMVRTINVMNPGEIDNCSFYIVMRIFNIGAVCIFF